MSFNWNCCEKILGCLEGAFLNKMEKLPPEVKKIEDRFFSIRPVGGFEEEHFENKGPLAKGHAVYKVIAPDSKPYALKLPASEKHEFAISNEAKILGHLNRKDPNEQVAIVRIRGVYDGIHGKALLLDLKKTSLLDRIQERGKFSIRSVRIVIEELARALVFLKERGVIHGDLSPANVFVSEDGRIYIGDFGGSVLKEPGKNKWVTHLTPRYMSPEMMLDIEHEYPADVWSLACIIFSLATGEELFRGDKHGEVILNQEQRMGFLYPGELLAKASDRGKQRYEDSKKVRSLTECLHSAIGKGFKGEVLPEEREAFEGLLRGMLRPKPKERMTPEKVLNNSFMHLKKA